MKHIFIRFLLALVVVISLAECAKRGTPTGGPKDEDAPVLVRSTPDLNTTNFNSKEITISFDELVKLKDIQKNLIVSPPMDPAPSISPQGSASKNIKITIKDTLTENTTYVINFGQSVTDNNEGNPFSYFKYVFSTGAYIDSLTVAGEIKDAYNKQTDEFVTVMLYEYNESFNDSTIYNEKPMYVTNTLDSTTLFEITNIKPGAYKLLALKDKASNFLYNKKSDKIAFHEEVITLPTDSVFTLTLFNEPADYRATNPTLIAENHILFGFEGDSTGMKIELLSDKPETYTSQIIADQKTDTLHYWFTPFEADSLLFKVSHQEVIDTFTVRTKELKKDSLTLEPTLKSVIPPGKIFKIKSNTPLAKVNNDSIHIIDQDSASVSFTTKIDRKLNEVIFDFKTSENNRYTMQLLPGSITDMYQKSNDSVKYSLKTKKLSEYGTMTVKLGNVTHYPVIVQLTDKSGNVKEEQVSKGTETAFYFESIEPSTYLLRVIYDDNENGKWDTGDYFNKIQPEEIHYFPEAIELRANWDFEQQFILD